ncbi:MULTISPECIES: anthrone oxygenase family protein [unclassified Chryseobacterium]|uniref:anthrone oxygenase family protein n=1 Tax=unclassified Chryseobacterium TaxID=2593645 RepID=UPI00100B8D63|nr:MULTISPECIES: anthrone oxygenase family protein [unclassified Chryseobacterium]RXM53491.1 hypothetical protein BOQ64_03805 [Chryseobacterium sp. CH25]RXM63615.1 hypothetical protein BOQ60_16890 [Chryseobacterium sp. CH1]
MKKDSYLPILSLITHSLFVGGCSVILFVLVPFWQKITAEEFLVWFSSNSKSVGLTMLPLEAIPLLISISTYIIAYKQKLNTKNLWFYNLLCNVVILIMFFLYFMPANTAMASKTIPIEHVAQELKRWELLHILRTLLAILSILFCGIAIKKAQK